MNPSLAARALGPSPANLRHWAMDALYGALTVVLSPYALGRVLLQEKTRARWRVYLRDIAERFRRRRPRRSDAPCVWVHGVSVGEVKAAARLVEAMERLVPGLEAVITVSTDTARRVAKDLYADRRIDFYPPDLSWVVKDALDAVHPDLILLVESEFWPNFLTAAAARRIPVVLVNGRMSERSCRRFRLLRPAAGRVLAALRLVCVQLETYAERFASVGVDAARIHVTGNMKFDNIPIRVEDPRREAFRRLVGDSPERAWVVAGSTHPTEERALAAIERRLRERGLSPRLIVAPRHPARADAVEADMRREGLEVVRRSALVANAPPPPDAVILLDTVGELEIVYALARVVFVGGTLVRHGGQNVMEPASLARPVVIGPSFQNFRGEVEMLLHADGLAVVPDAAGVERTLVTWLEDPEAARALGQRGYEAIAASKGATEATTRVLGPLLDETLRATRRRRRATPSRRTRADSPGPRPRR